MDINIQFLSDVHIEQIHNEYILIRESCDKVENFWSKITKIEGDIVILCGDIGNPLLSSYDSFISYVSSKCKKLLVISGNHEYWNNTISETDDMIRNITKKYRNVKFLQRDYFIIDKYVILGCTLWSYIPPQFKKEIEGWSGDFKNIKDFKTIEINNELHFKDLKWLTDAIYYFRRNGLIPIVATHYTPCFELNFNPRFVVQCTTFHFSSNLKFLYPHVGLWIYGHTHFDYNREHIYKLKDYQTIFASNQRGYPKNPKSTYSMTKTINILNIEDIPSNLEYKVFSYDENYVKEIQCIVNKWMKRN